ncbi:pentapeptide repeat-containing protein [Streptomyces sp. NPDC052015]|uniref:pentapeptide repeat-containing protein n=1 Tax=Streptomyces sp. NPDC052015 TaxID=3154755 RepID=UPI003449AFB1
MTILTGAGALGLLAGLPWLVWQGPYMIDAKYLDRKSLAEGSAALVTGLRTAVVAGVAALGAGIALLYTARTYRLTRRGQITERFTKALERLGSDQQYVRIGGILGLEQIVRDAPEQAATDAARVLGHFIRDRAPMAASARPAFVHDDESQTPALPDLPDELAADVQAALTALTRAESRTHVDPREVLDLHALHLAGAALNQADLTDANLRQADLDWANLSEAALPQANMHEAGLVRTNLHAAILREVNLDKAKLSGANLSKADLSGANLAGASVNEVNLTAATLFRADLTAAILSGANLSEANLSEATLARADLYRARLDEANLTRVKLTDADLTEALLTGVDLTGADLTGAKLTRADLTGADLTGAKLSRADLTGADLTGVKGLSQPLPQARTNEASTVPPEH